MPNFNGQFTDHVVTVCWKCEDRHVGCHAVCAKYLAQKEEMKRLREQENDGVRREMSVLSHRVKLLHTKKKMHDARCKH